MSRGLWRDDRWSRDLSELPTRVLSPGTRPRRFQKTDFTGEELMAALRKCRVNDRLRPPPDPPLARPGMTLGPGHQALFVTSGLADGVVEPEGEPAFAVRGTVSKEPEVDPERSSTDPETGTTTTYITERATHTVRCVTPDGQIYTFTTATPKPEPGEAAPEGKGGGGSDVSCDRD